MKSWRQFALLAAVVFLIVALFSSPSLTQSGKAIPVTQRKGMPDFAYAQLNGTKWRLSDYRGEVVFLNFWAPWCPPCRAETPGLVRLQQRFQANGLIVAGVDVDGEARAAASFARQFNVRYPLLLPPAGSPLTDQIESLPTSFLLDRSGRVARTYVGAVSEFTLTADVNSILREQGTARRS